MDHRGRLADKVVIEALDWVPGTRLEVREDGGLIVLTAGPGGPAQVTLRGHLQLPPAVRHWAGIGAGDRVLLAAEPAHRTLVVHPPSALHAMVTAYHAFRLGGDAA